MSTTKGDTENYEEPMRVVRDRLKEAIAGAKWIIEVPSWAVRVTVNHVVSRLQKVGTIRTTRLMGKGKMTKRDATIEDVRAPVLRDETTRKEVL